MYFQKGNEAIKAENYGIARTMLTKSLDFDKDNPDIMGRLAQVHIVMGHADEAAELLERSIRRRPNHPDTLLALSHAYMEQGRVEDMHGALDKALAWDPTHGACLHAKAMGYINSGRPELARETLDRAGDIERPHALILMAHAKLARAEKRYADAIDALNRLLEHEGALDRHKRSARFELGHCYDALGEYDRAFASFTAGNGGHIQGKVLHADTVIATWSRDLLDALPPADTGSQRPVFIVGMPRSGTTLTEQVLQAHPAVESVGECPLAAHLLARKSPPSLTGADTESYAHEYLAMLDQRVGTEAARVADKHMGAERTLGLISRMFPGARVIQCLRDPIDVCLSAYFQNFGSNVSYSRDLRQLGEQHRAHTRIMDYWREVLDLSFLPSRYEELVADFEPGARRLIGHIGLDFHEDCLRFHESRQHVGTASSVQVRSPIYQSSTQRWRNYEKHLGPLFDALGPLARTRAPGAEHGA